MSGVTVATMIRSISSAVMPAFSSAFCAALAAMSLVHSSSAAMRRSLMPVRERIHSSEVSTIFSNSALVRTRSGKYEPVPMMETVRLGRCVRVRGLGSGWLMLLVMISLHLLDKAWIEVVADHLGRGAQGVFDRQRRGAAMRDDGDAVDAEQR